jgi:glycerophosphoryl diester phosphodiesterase
MIPVLVAHRGYMKNYPENTLSSIRAAIEVGACMVEFDVQMDASGRLWLLHDDNFQRTADTDACLFTQPDCAAISVHEPARLGEVFNPEPVPELGRVLALLKSYPRVTAFVEIKDNSLQRWGLERVMDRLLACLEPVTDQSVLIADNLDALLYASQRADQRTGWVIHSYDAQLYQQAEKHCPDYLICNYQRITGALWQGPWQWMLYDIADPALAMDWAEKGAELIETCDIGAMLQHPALQQRACR